MLHPQPLTKRRCPAAHAVASAATGRTPIRFLRRSGHPAGAHHRPQTVMAKAIGYTSALTDTTLIAGSWLTPPSIAS